MSLFALPLSALFTGILWWMYRGHHRNTKIGRAGLFDLCTQLLDGPQRELSESGYAKLQGHYRGYPVTLVLEEDHTVMRKIPSLWLHVTVKGQGTLTEGTLDLLVRPQNTEFYSPSWDWEWQVEAPAGWPEHALYRSKDKPPALPLLDAHVRRLFADAKAKELLVLPHMVRLTYQAKQAERGEYLLLRMAEFDRSPLEPELVKNLLDQAVAIRQELEGEKSS